MAARESEALKREAASREERVAALEAEASRARAIHTQALGDLKAQHKVSLAAQEDEFAQALKAEREKQAALATAKAVALAETNAKTAKAAERAAEEAPSAWEVAAAKQRQFVGELEAEHARALQAAEQTAKARRRDLCDAYAVESGELEARPQAVAEANAAAGQAVAEANAAQQRELKKVAAVTAARETAKNVAAETDTAKADEARAAHRVQFEALEVRRAEQLASVVAETAAEAEARHPEQLASAVVGTAAEAEARHPEQLASAVVETTAEAEERQSAERASAVA